MPEARGRKRPSKEYKNKLTTRKMLLQAGTEVVMEKGFRAVGSVENVQRTGISKCSFYYYSKTKEGFGLERINLYRDSIIQELERCLAESEFSPLSHLQAFVVLGHTALLQKRC